MFENGPEEKILFVPYRNVLTQNRLTEAGLMFYRTTDKEVVIWQLIFTQKLTM